MSSLVRPTTSDDEKQLIVFLTGVFSAGRDAPFVNPSLLRWKYWDPRADCSEPRSFVMERDGEIIAHVGLWPVTVGTGGRTERGIHMIDWASAPQAPGAGVSLLQRLSKTYDFIIAIGGTKMTQSVLPKVGFSIVAEALTWARPIRPWRQMLHHQSRDVRLPARFVRNIWWARTPPRAVERGWTAVEASTGGAEGPVVPAGERDESFFRYLQQCPLAPCRLFHIVNDEGRKSGLFVLSVVWEQCRLAGVWLADPSPENWRIAFHLAQAAALKHTKTSELVARCATDAGASGAAQAGMRLRGRAPVFLFRKDHRTEPLPLQFNLADNDAVFLGGRSSGFLT